jgi:hypothetical protein
MEPGNCKLKIRVDRSNARNRLMWRVGQIQADKMVWIFPTYVFPISISLASERETGCYLRVSVFIIFSCGFNRWYQWYTTCSTLVDLCLWLGFFLCLEATLFVFFLSLSFIYPCVSHKYSVVYTNHTLMCTKEGNLRVQRFLRFSELLILVQPSE